MSNYFQQYIGDIPSQISNVIHSDVSLQEKVHLQFYSFVMLCIWETPK